MDQVSVDIRTRIVQPTLRIWRLFPGSDYMFFSTFEQQSAVFLDFPGLSLEEGPVEENSLHLAERIMIARAVRDWAWTVVRAQRRGEDLSSESGPDRNIEIYTEQRRPRGLGNDKGAVAGLFGKAQQGDLVIVPSPMRTRRVLIGEFLDKPETRISVTTPHYGSEKILARRVHWFPPVNELELPERVSEVIRRPNPFVAFDIRMYGEIFDKSFGTYVHNGEYNARFDTRADLFRADHNFSLSILVEAIAALLSFIETGSTDEIENRLLEIAGRAKEGIYESDLAININSPGSILFKSKSIVPLMFAAIFALASAANAEQRQPGRIKIVNSLAPPEHDACTPKVDERVRAALNLMQIEVWREACRQSRRLREQPQMDGTSRIVPNAPQLGSSPKP